MEVRFISLPGGDSLEVSCTEEFYVKLRKHYGLAENARVLDIHIRDFFASQLHSAIRTTESK